MWKGLALGTAALGAGLLLRSEYEKNHFLVEELAIASPKIQKEHRFIFITDVHDKEFGPGNCRLFEAIRKIKPEGIFIGGDVMVSRGGTTLTATFALLEGLVSIAPVYYALGNHESRMEAERGNYGDKYEQLLKKAGELGVVMLIDQNLFLGNDLAVAGVRLSQRYYQKLFLKNPLPMPETYLFAKLGRAAKERYQILLMHSPLYFRACRQWGGRSYPVRSFSWRDNPDSRSWRDDDASVPVFSALVRGKFSGGRKMDGRGTRTGYSFHQYPPE